MFQLYAMHWSITGTCSCVEIKAEYSSRVLYAADSENSGRKESQNQSRYLTKTQINLREQKKQSGLLRSAVLQSLHTFF